MMIHIGQRLHLVLSVTLACGALACLGNVLPHNINLRFRKKIDGVIKDRAVTSRPPVMMMEISVGSNVNVCTICE